MSTTERPTRTYSGRADPDAVYAFARATNDTNERYVAGDAVPPLFTASLILDSWSPANRDAASRAGITGYTGGVHGEHDIIYHSPVRPGAAVRWYAEPYGVRQVKGGALVTGRVLMSDLDGAPLVEHFWSSLYIGGKVRTEFGLEPPDHAFPPEARRHPAGSRTLFIDRDQAFRYAGVTGDRIGHSIDDEIARGEGFPGKIVQGLCTFGMCSAAAVDIIADGDPDRLGRLACRFAAPTRPDRELAVEFYDAGYSRAGGQQFAFEAVQGGVPVVKHGRVELRSA